MLTRLNTLYVMTQGAWLSKEGECIEVRTDQGSKRIPIHMIGGGIVTFGNVMITPFLMGHCVNHQVPITCLTEHGRFLASIGGASVGNVRVRHRQHRASDDPASAALLAKRFLIGKLANARTILRRGARERPDTPGATALTNVADRLSVTLDRLMRHTFPLAELRGMEGDAAAQTFGVFEHLLAPSGFHFPGRVRRPPTDPVNALLSFLYTLLAHDCAAALISAGLDPQIGFLHQDRPGRASLALDLMEELRPLLADRLVLALLNRRQLSPHDFTTEAIGVVSLSESARKTVLVAWQERKKRTLVHPFTHQEQPLGLIPFIQSALLARHLRGDLEDYPPFIWK